MSLPARVAVLASGGGSNLQALIDRFHPVSSPVARVELVVASRPGIGALERARRAGVASVALGGQGQSIDARERAMMEGFDAHRIDLVVLAGYLQLVPPAVVERFRNRMLNIHPALLPAFGGQGMYGMRVHEAVIASGVRVSGATVHLVDERYDTGAIIAQWPVPVLPTDTPDRLASRVLKIEHLLLPAAVEAIVRGGVLESVAEPVAFELVPRPAPERDTIEAVASPASRSLS